MHLDLSVFFFFSFMSEMIKGFHFLRCVNAVDVQQLKVYCLPTPQTDSNYHAHGDFAKVLKRNSRYDYRRFAPFFKSCCLGEWGKKRSMNKRNCLILIQPFSGYKHILLGCTKKSNLLWPSSRKALWQGHARPLSVRPAKQKQPHPTRDALGSLLTVC